MPFLIIKNPKKGYSVINRITGHNFSPKGIPLARAKQQLKALHLHIKDLEKGGHLKSVVGGRNPRQTSNFCMPLSSLIKEHKRLVGILTDGTKKEQHNEAKDQAKELQKYIRIKKHLKKEIVGGSQPEDGELEGDNLIHQAMSDVDLHKYFPNAKILKYSELPKGVGAEAILPKIGDLIFLLYESSPNVGHWTAIARGKNAYYYFDSYGNKPDVPLSWSDEETRKALGENEPTLTKMFALTKEPIYYNDFDYQSKGDKKMATCGRWATAFLTHFKKYGGNLKTFKTEIVKDAKEEGLPLDNYIATVITE